jgi:hypothetical protein
MRPASCRAHAFWPSRVAAGRNKFILAVTLSPHTPLAVPSFHHKKDIAMKLNPRSLLAAVVACSLALPGAVMADKRGHDRDGGHGSQRHYSQGHNRHNGGRYYGHNGGHYYRHYDGHHYRGHKGYSGNTYKYYYDDDDDEDLLIGLAVGGVLGYALNSAQHPQRYETAPPPPRPYRNAYPADESYNYSGDTCLQEREYTTTVQIGGRNVEAYGTACLQPDGSWKRGPAEPVSY